MSEVLLKDGVKYDLWAPGNEPNEFEPMIKYHTKDIFGENCVWFEKTKIPTIPEIERIPDGFVVDFTNKKWYIVELKILCKDAIARIGTQISDDEEIPKNLNALRKINQSIKNNIDNKELKRSIGDIVLSERPRIIVIIDSLDGSLGEQFKKRAKGANKIIEFKTFARDNVDARKEYRIPILEALIEMGSKGQMKDVLEKVHEKMKDKLTAKDHELLPSGTTIRWKNFAQWQRQRMKEEGLLKRDSPHGIWEITKKGEDYYHSHK